jgi:cbb3-type cytochrome oxidase subunit 3
MNISSQIIFILYRTKKQRNFENAEMVSHRT